jgi:TPR repeat protein
MPEMDPREHSLIRATVLHLPPPKAADQCWNLGLEAMVRGDGATALKMFESVSEDSQWQGEYMLGLIHLSILPDRDVLAAVKHLENAARDGGAMAKCGLAIALISCDRVVELKRAAGILQELCDENQHAAQILLGLLLLDGRLGEVDAPRAVSLWTSAAEGEWVWAMQLLADRCRFERQLLRALRWKWIAFVTTFRLAKVDKDDIRLTNAV